MGKVSTSFSIDEDVLEYLQQNTQINNSGLVNRFLREYMATGTVDGIEFRLERIEAEIEETELRLERLKAERDELRTIKTRRDQEQDEELEEIMEFLTSISHEKLGKENAAIVENASKLNMTPRQLVEKVRDRKGRF